MKIKLLVLLSFFALNQIIAQCVPPPPLGAGSIYSLDMDNDGFAVFDVGYYIDYIERPARESEYLVSSSGYDFVFYNSNNVLSPLMYSNIVLGEWCTVNYEYSGTGPTFEPQPPCYFQVQPNISVQLIAVPYNGDDDGDGILNVDEDANHNSNLMDDDDDNDGIINLKDNVNNLAAIAFNEPQFTVVINPVNNGILTFESNMTISSVIVYDLNGKEVSENKIYSNLLTVDKLSSGMYIFKFQSQGMTIIKKVLIK